MKVQKPVAQEKIPPREKGLPGRKTNPEYDRIAEQVRSLDANQSIPVICETKGQVTTLILSMKRRKLHAEYRGLTVYISNPKGRKKPQAKK